jgi:colanic acid/amylovoran biosynthesis protein
MTKHVLVHAYTANNLGDDLFLKVLLERYPDTKFLLIAPTSYKILLSRYDNVELITPPFFSFWNRIVNLLIRGFSKSIVQERFYKLWHLYFMNLSEKIDAYVLISGSAFMESLEGELSMSDRINGLIVGLFYDKPKFIIGANFGPFVSQMYIDYYKSIFKEYDDICFRDLYSKELFPTLLNIRYCPDIVFQLNIPKVDKKSKNVGISLIDLTNRGDLNRFKNIYIESICNLITSYINNGYYVYLFSFCKIEGDERCISQVINNLPIHIKNEVRTVLYREDIVEFLKIFGSMEIMISSRFHAMILSLVFQQKIYPIVYSDKMSNVLKDLNYSGTYSRIEEMTALDIEKVISEVDNNSLSIDLLPKKSEEQFLKLDEYLEVQMQRLN